MRSGSEAGSYLRLIDFVYHSTLDLRVLKKKAEKERDPYANPETLPGGRVPVRAHNLFVTGRRREAGPPNHHDDKVDSDQ